MRSEDGKLDLLLEGFRVVGQAQGDLRSFKLRWRPAWSCPAWRKRIAKCS